jgi:pimeloyl-ACP methyl ester carboxylesterase
LPYLAALMNPGAAPDAVRAQGDAIRELYSTLSPEQIEAQTRLALTNMISDPAKIDVAAGWARASDGATIGRAVAEMMTTDLRPRLGAITAPVLLIAAAKPFTDAAMRERVAQAYEAQVAMVPTHSVVLAASARHFVMLDDPAFLFGVMDEFLATSRGGSKAPPSIQVLELAPGMETGRRHGRGTHE